MKPLNLDNRPCSPISSNCVIWQGPTLDCINLCAGDTISDVVANLATELCTLLDQTNVNNYDLTCLGITACGPKDFQALIQLLIDKICELNGVSPDTTKVNDCPDCIVSVASCFAENGPTMQLLDYVQMIGEKICALIDEIANLQSQIDNLDIRVTILENTPPPTFTLPSIDTNCLAPYMSGQVSATIDLVLNTLLNDPTIGYCALIGATGLPTELLASVASQCITSSTPTASNPPVPFGTEYVGTWVGSPTTVADAITNLWIVICDIYDAVSSFSLNVTDTNTVNLTFTSGILRADMQDTGWVPILGFSYMSGAPFRPECRRIGNVIHFKGTIYVPIGTLNSGGGGTAIPVSDPDDYNGLASGFTFNTLQASSGSDPDACLLKGPSYVPWTVATPPNEALRLEFHRGNSVIPPGILGSGETLDGGATVSGRVICERVGRSTDTKDIAMTGVIGLSISSTGVLIVTSANFNDTYRGTANCVGKTSLTRQLCTTAIAGENIPEYFGTAPSQFNAPSPPPGTYAPTLVASADTYAFSQDMSRAEQLAGLAINISGITAFVEDCSGNTPTFVNC